MHLLESKHHCQFLKQGDGVLDGLGVDDEA